MRKSVHWATASHHVWGTKGSYGLERPPVIRMELAVPWALEAAVEGTACVWMGSSPGGSLAIQLI